MKVLHHRRLILLLMMHGQLYVLVAMVVALPGISIQKQHLLLAAVVVLLLQVVSLDG